MRAIGETHEEAVVHVVRSQPIVELRPRVERDEGIAGMRRPDGPVLDRVEDVVELAVVLQVRLPRVGIQIGALDVASSVLGDDECGADATHAGPHGGHRGVPVIRRDRGVVDRRDQSRVLVQRHQSAHRNSLLRAPIPSPTPPVVGGLAVK